MAKILQVAIDLKGTSFTSVSTNGLTYATASFPKAVIDIRNLTDSSYISEASSISNIESKAIELRDKEQQVGQVVKFRITVNANVGYKFTSWSNGATSNPYEVSPYTGSIVIYPNISSVSPATIKFSSDGSIISQKTVSYNDVYGTLPSPSKTGYTFLGWYTAATGGTKVVKTDICTVEGTQTLYAHWNINRYNVSISKGTNESIKEFYYSTDNVSFTKISDDSITVKVEYNKTIYYYGIPNTGFADGDSNDVWYQGIGTKESPKSVKITADLSISITSYSSFTTIKLDPNGGDTIDDNCRTATGLTKVTTSSGKLSIANYNSYPYGTARFQTVSSGSAQATVPTTNDGYITFSSTGQTSGTAIWSIVSTKHSKALISGSRFTIVAEIIGATGDKPTEIRLVDTGNSNQRSQLSQVRFTDPSKFVTGQKLFSVATTSGYDDVMIRTWCRWEVGQVGSVQMRISLYGGTYVNADNFVYKASRTSVQSPLPIPTRHGYTFIGWFTAPTGGTQIQSGYKLTESQTFYAHWTASSYTIKYYVDGVETSLSPSSYTYGTATTLPTPVKTGYTFDGWSIKSDLSGTLYKSLSATATGNKTFYAHWTAKTITVSFSLNGRPGTTPDSIQVTFGQPFGELPIASSTVIANKFVGWFKATGGTAEVTADTIVYSENDITLYAHWTTRPMYHLTVKKDDGIDTTYYFAVGTSNRFSEFTDASIYEGLTVRVYADTEPGYYCQYHSEETALEFVMPSSNYTVNLTAERTGGILSLVKNEHISILYYSINDVEESTTITKDVIVPIGASWSAYAIAETGWVSNYTYDNPKTGVMTLDGDIFSPIASIAKGTIKLEITEGLDKIKYRFGTIGEWQEVSITTVVSSEIGSIWQAFAVPKQGYKSIRWSKENPQQGTISTTEAKFNSDVKPIYVLLMFDGNGGIVEGTYPSMVVKYGSIPNSSISSLVFPSATIRRTGRTRLHKSYNNTGWYTESGNRVQDTDIITFTSNTRLIAKWDHVSQKIIVFFNLMGGEYTEDEQAREDFSTSVEVEYDNTLTRLPAVEREGYVFLGWFEHRYSGNQITLQSKFKADCCIYARWRKI